MEDEAFLCIKLSNSQTIFCSEHRSCRRERKTEKKILRKKQRIYELLGGGSDGVDHIADSVALEQAVLVVGWLVLELLHNEPLEPLRLLVTRPSHLQQRR